MTYPGLSWMELNNMINLCKIFNPGWTESEIDRIFEENMQVIIAVIDEDELKCDYDPSQHG